MALAKPIVASSVGQQTLVIDDGKTGLHCLPGNPESLAEAIKRIYEDSEFASTLGYSARMKVIQQYDWRMYNQRIFERLGLNA
jgi:glycosyltransferase involved in cell wall biosynthesis